MSLLHEVFPVSGTVVLDLDSIPTEINIKRGDSDSEVSVTIKGDEKYAEQVSAALDGQTVRIRGPQNYFSASVSSAGGVTSVTNIQAAGSVSITGGRVVVDGVDVTELAAQTDSDSEPLVFEVTVPDGTELVIGKVANLNCAPDLGNVRLRGSGQSRVALGVVGELDANISGQSKLSASRVTGGRIRLDVSGQSHIDLNGIEDAELDLSASGQGSIALGGSFRSARVETSGQTQVRTNGLVSGNYTAIANGMSGITHTGGVEGTVENRASMMSEVSIS